MPVYVVTGTRGGIGLEYVRQLSSDPSNVVFALVRNPTGSNISALETIQTDATGTVHIIDCDISSDENISGLADRVRAKFSDVNSAINMLINNAAILDEDKRGETSLNLTSKSLWNHIETNTMGPARVLQALLPSLAPDALVANISSGIGSLEMLADGRITAELTAYSISKTALNMLTVHQAKQLADRGITVVAVDPGHVKTEMGGPGAVVEIPDSARGVLKTLHGLTHKDTGKFVLYTGEELPW
ncbi:C-factor [Rhypophila decipiens]|uniref:C-factor n=1 Tax=Rhypophila decipiens TaxID=261697 RepID=A0AAN6XT70_9PEZI|nr:C-factor [Rhypophila decipiens]